MTLTLNQSLQWIQVPPAHEESIEYHKAGLRAYASIFGLRFKTDSDFDRLLTHLKLNYGVQPGVQALKPKYYFQTIKGIRKVLWTGPKGVLFKGNWYTERALQQLSIFPVTA